MTVTERVAAKLHGGPMHGKRITVSQGCDRVIVPHLPHLPAIIITGAPPRPPWWRPLARRRWQPPTPPEPPTFRSLVYRYLATDDHGLRIYAHDPYDRRPGEGEPLGPDLTTEDGLSYHDLHITTTEIPRTSIFNLPYGLQVICTRVSGWELWDMNQVQHLKGLPPSRGVLLAGEYGGPGKWLVLDVAGHVIADSHERGNPHEDS